MTRIFRYLVRKLRHIIFFKIHRCVNVLGSLEDDELLQNDITYGNHECNQEVFLDNEEYSIEEISCITKNSCSPAEFTYDMNCNQPEGTPQQHNSFYKDDIEYVKLFTYIDINPQNDFTLQLFDQPYDIFCLHDIYTIRNKNSLFLKHLLTPVPFIKLHENPKVIRETKNENTDEILYTVYRNCRRHAMVVYLINRQLSAEFKPDAISSFNITEDFMNLFSKSRLKTTYKTQFLIFDKLKHYVYFITIITIKHMIFEDSSYWDNLLKERSSSSTKHDIKQLLEFYIDLFIDSDKFESLCNTVNDSGYKSFVFNIHKAITSDSCPVQFPAVLKNCDDNKKLLEIKEKLPFLEYINNLWVIGDDEIVLFPKFYVDRIINLVVTHLFC